MLVGNATYNRWYYPTFSFYGQVREDATGITLNSSVATITMVNNPIQLSFEGSEVFKPGFPLTVKVFFLTLKLY